MEILLKNVNESLKFADQISKIIKSGMIIGFVGELGAGKTTIIKRIARNLGVKDSVTSPTFVIYKKYKTIKKCYLVHIDAYRLSNDSEIVIKEIVENKNHNIVFIEWADRIQMPKNSIIIYIEYDEVDQHKRKIKYENIN